MWGPKMRCTYLGCDRPEESCGFFFIKEGKTAGRYDWRPLVGSILCSSCHSRYMSRGTLERSNNRPIDPKQKRCTYVHCESPDKSIRFHLISKGNKAGKQDWSSLVGMVLCQTCYDRYKGRGTLQKFRRPAKAYTREQYGARLLDDLKYLEPVARYAEGDEDEECDDEYEESAIDTPPEPEELRPPTAGPVHSPPCRRAAVGEGIKRKAGKRKAACKKEEDEDCLATVKKAASGKEGRSEARGGAQDQSRQEEGQGRAECILCSEEGATSCIVPCGHLLLCANCGDQEQFRLRKRQPLTECPVCREEMCEPFVMDAHEWEELGGMVL